MMATVRSRAHCHRRRRRRRRTGNIVESSTATTRTPPPRRRQLFRSVLPSTPPSAPSLLLLLTAALVVLLDINKTPIVATFVHAQPKTRPYVAHRTNPFDQPNANTFVPHRRGGSTEEGENVDDRPASVLTRVGFGGDGQEKEEGEDPHCPLSFKLGLTHRSHHRHRGSHGGGSGSGSGSSATEGTGAGSIRAPPSIYPALPSSGTPGRAIVYATEYETLDLLTPSVPSEDNGFGGEGGGDAMEGVDEAEGFPLLFEGSSFGSIPPVLHDANADGVVDAIVADYDGTIHVVGLDYAREEDSGGGRKRRKKRHYAKIQIPRLYVRKRWYDVALNRTREEDEKEYDPYHTYFEYGSEWRNELEAKVLRAVPVDVLGQSVDQVKGLAGRKKEAGRKLVEMTQMDQMVEQERNAVEEVNAKLVGEEQDSGSGKPWKVDGQDGDRRRLQEEQAVPGGENAAGEDAPPAEDAPVADGNEGGGGGGDEGGARGATPNEGEEEGAPPPDMNEGGGREEGERHHADLDEERRDEHEGFFGPTDDDTFRDGELNPEMEEGIYGGGGTDDAYEGGGGDDMYNYRGGGDDIMYDPDRVSYDDYYGNMYRGDHEHHERYYDDSQYLRLPPHVLSAPAILELPKLWGNEEGDYTRSAETHLVLAVSYYFDEDEYTGPLKHRRYVNTDGGDETEALRGRHVASAILSYNLDNNQWNQRELLDLSTDWTSPVGNLSEAVVPSEGDKEGDGGTEIFLEDDEGKNRHHRGLGAFALASPTVADLNGDSRPEVIVPTSMGMVYVLDGYHMMARDGFPVQMRYPVKHRVAVEDAVGDTNLELFAVDLGGNLICLDHQGKTVWHRYLLQGDDGGGAEDDRGATLEVHGTSPMTLGDVDGTGTLAVVLAVRVILTRSNGEHHEETRLYALDAKTGDDLQRFPVVLGPSSTVPPQSSGDHDTTPPLPQPLLVDLHARQGHWLDRLRANATAVGKDSSAFLDKQARAANDFAALTADKEKTHRHGGDGWGLHVVQPVGSTLYFLEGGTGCAQTLDVGDDVSAMVQADDVHGTGGLDLIVTTASGEVVTLDSGAVPHHPLNVWNSGPVRSRINGHAQGYGATQGLFVHPVSREYRDILGLYVPITFEIFDRRPNIAHEPDRQKYTVDVRDGTSIKRALFVKAYDKPGTYTERIYIRYGPGYYSLTVRLTTTHGIVHEDVFHVGYNVGSMAGLPWMLVLPLVIVSIPLFCYRRKPNWEEDEDYGTDNSGMSGRGLGILGRAPPSTT